MVPQRRSALGDRGSPLYGTRRLEIRISLRKLGMIVIPYPEKRDYNPSKCS